MCGEVGIFMGPCGCITIKLCLRRTLVQLNSAEHRSNHIKMLRNDDTTTNNDPVHGMYKIKDPAYTGSQKKKYLFN